MKIEILKYVKPIHVKMSLINWQNTSNSANLQSKNNNIEKNTKKENVNQ